MIVARRSCLLFGEAPNRAGFGRDLHVKLAARCKNQDALWKRSAGDFLQLVKKGDPALWSWLRVTTHRNLLDYYPGERFPTKIGREVATKMWDGLVAGRPRDHLVMLAGRAVASCFQVEADYWVPIEKDGLRIVVVPHPSGLNRYWNDLIGRQHGLDYLRAEGARLLAGSEIAQGARTPSAARIIGPR